MLQPLEVYLVVGVNSVDGSAWMGIVIQQCNTLHYDLLAFCSRGWFRLVPECLIVMEFQCCVTLSYSVG